MFINRLIILSFLLFSCIGIGHAQCEFGDRYSDHYLNIKRLNKKGDTSYIHYLTNGTPSGFILDKVDRKDNYTYHEDLGYVSNVKIKFDSSSRVQIYHYKYNSGWAGSAGRGAYMTTYHNNGNLRYGGGLSEHHGVINIYDTISYQECETIALPKLKSNDCINLFSKWYVIIGERSDGIKGWGFFTRRKFIKNNEYRVRIITLDWNDGFDIDEKVIQEMILGSDEDEGT